MQSYNTVIVAVDLSEKSAAVINRAQSLAESMNAQLHLVHIVECLNLNYGGDIPIDFSNIQEELQNQAKQRLQTLASDAGIDTEYQHLLVGRPESQIHQLSETLNADLIVLGSHARQGLDLLFGSVADGVLHGAHCDVLAVQV